MSEKIGFFIREEPYGFLSNFDRTPFVGWSNWGVALYPTNEHFYQSHKANSREIHDYIREAPNATIAMVLGRQLEHNKHLQKYMAPNWDMIKRDIMLKGLRAKFANLELRKMLLDTGDAVLYENNPEDAYWGIGDGSGESWLGKLLMQVRDEIRSETDSSSG